tara:strand:- start:243 stop:608 length:366 start_codon:yes stop_codon:yes gene_type:complete
MTIRNWAECQPYIGHDNILIHHILGQKNTEGMIEEAAKLEGKWALHRHSLQPGKQGDFHTHGAEHVFFVLAGSGKIKMNDDFYDIKVGDAIHVAPEVGHQNFNTGEDWLDLLVITAFSHVK